MQPPFPEGQLRQLPLDHFPAIIVRTNCFSCPLLQRRLLRSHWAWTRTFSAKVSKTLRVPLLKEPMYSLRPSQLVAVISTLGVVSLVGPVTMTFLSQITFGLGFFSSVGFSSVGLVPACALRCLSTIFLRALPFAVIGWMLLLWVHFLGVRYGSDVLVLKRSLGVSGGDSE